jgi:pimeloyl-ACP methyl ester carboxylesterase
MADERSARVEVPGGALYYVARGSGPALLIAPGGDGDADTCAGVAASLSDTYTVIRYDRRGIARSTGGATSVNVGIHADDAATLLAAVAAGPAHVFGTSLGALIGLDLAARHPDHVHTLVAHEPPLPQVLTAADRDAGRADQERIERVYRHEGLDAAMRALVEVTGVDVRDREPGAERPVPGARRRHTLVRMLTYETPAARRFQADLDTLTMSPARIVVGGGVVDGFPRRSATALAARLGRPYAAFPGGHTGYATHPAAFAARLREVLRP